MPPIDAVPDNLPQEPHVVSDRSPVYDVRYDETVT